MNIDPFRCPKHPQQGTFTTSITGSALHRMLTTCASSTKRAQDNLGRAKQKLYLLKLWVEGAVPVENSVKLIEEILNDLFDGECQKCIGTGKDVAGDMTCTKCHGSGALKVNK